MSTVTAVPIPPTKRRYLIYLWAGVVLALIAAVALARQGSGVVTTPSGLQYKVLKPGTGTNHPADTDVALIQYEGRLTDGTVFDKSQQPTPLPVAGVVPGFSEGLKLMTKGARYRFWLKPNLGYGDKQVGTIPPNSTLVFDVDLLDFIPEAVVRQLQQQQMMQQMQRGGGAGAGTGGMPQMPGAPGPQ